MRDFTEGSAAKHIMAFALPILIGNVFHQFYNVTDAMIVGRYVSGNALAAVGTSSSVINFLTAVLLGLTTGASVLISQLFGAKQEEKLKRAVSTSVIFLCSLTFIIILASFAFSPYFLAALRVPGEVFKDTLLYLRIIVIGMMATIIYNVCVAYLRALGDTKRPLYILIFAVALNVVLDLFFVAALGFGVAGAAVATIIAQTLGAFLSCLYIIKYAPELRITKLVFDKELFGPILKYSVPAAVQLSVTSFATLTITRLINSFGAISVAGFVAANKIDDFAIMPLHSVSTAISTYVAQNMGAGKEERAKKGFYTSFILMLAVAALLSGMAYVFRNALISMFVDMADTNAAEIIAVGSKYLSIIACFYVLFAIFFAFNGFFRGVGDAVIVMILTITSLSIRSYFAHFLAGRYGLGPEAVAWSIPIGWGLCSIFCVFYYKKRLWAGKLAIKTDNRNISNVSE